MKSEISIHGDAVRDRAEQGGQYVRRNFKVLDKVKGKNWFKYQGSVNGIDGAAEFALNGVIFDGMKGGVLLEAKAGFQWLFKKFPAQKDNILNKMYKQMVSQVEAAKGQKLEWHFQEAKTLNDYVEYLAKNGKIDILKNVTLISNPGK